MLAIRLNLSHVVGMVGQVLLAPVATVLVEAVAALTTS